jgi:hypothetical protein
MLDSFTKHILARSPALIEELERRAPICPRCGFGMQVSKPAFVGMKNDSDFVLAVNHFGYRCETIHKLVYTPGRHPVEETCGQPPSFMSWEQIENILKEMEHA